MQWAGNIAKTMTSNGKQFTVTRQMLTAVARDRWNLLGEQWILFPENLNVSRDEVEGNKIDCSPRDHSLNDLLYNKTKQNKSKIWKTRWGSSDNMRPPLITCSSGQHFAGNSELFPVWRHSFRNPAHGNWRETASLLDVMWKWSSQWMGAL